MIGDLAGFRLHAAARGDDALAAATDEAATAALVRATDYIRAHYPRAVALPAPELEDAAYLAAAAELARPGLLSPARSTGGAKVLTEVAGIKWQPIKADADASAVKPAPALVDALLARYEGPAPGEAYPFAGMVV